MHCSLRKRLICQVVQFTGHIKLNSAGTFVSTTAETGILPGDPLLTSAVTVTPDASKGGEYVAMKITLSDGTNSKTASQLGLTVNVSSGWTYDSTNNAYIYTGAGSTPAVMTSQTTALPYDVTTNPSSPVYGIVYNRNDNWDGNDFAEDSSYISDGGHMDQTMTVVIQFYSVQSANTTYATNLALLTELGLILSGS